MVICCSLNIRATFKDICEKEDHEVVAKAVLTGKSRKEFPLSQPWSKARPTKSMEVAQIKSLR